MTECRNELGPSYEPRPADVWSLGVVLLNMLFHRNPWTDPVLGNKNFDGFMEDPVEFLLTRFTGIGHEVAAYLAERVFSTDVDQRTSAREFGRWAKHLPNMIGGKKAVSALRMSYLNQGGAGAKDRDPLDFKKSPIEPRGASSALSRHTHVQNGGFSALTSGHKYKSSLSQQVTEALEESKSSELPIELEPPVSDTTQVSADPPPTESAAAASTTTGTDTVAVKRKKRGTRSKNKAANLAAAALMAGMPSSGIASASTASLAEKSEKETVLEELAEASQTLARELSRTTRSQTSSVIDLKDLADFPRLGQDVQPGQSKQSKWKALLSGSRGNPELQALIKKVQERNGISPNRSAPAKLQNIDEIVTGSDLTLDTSDQLTETPVLSHTATSQTVACSPPQSLPSGGFESDNWRKPVIVASDDARALPQGVVATKPLAPAGVVAASSGAHTPVSLAQLEDERGHFIGSGRPRRDGNQHLYGPSRPKRLDQSTENSSSSVPSLDWSQRSTVTSPVQYSPPYSTASTVSVQGKGSVPKQDGRWKNKQMDVSWEANESIRNYQFDRPSHQAGGDVFSR